MYSMTHTEFIQFERAKSRLFELRKNNEEELLQAYENIHPTRTVFDHHLGRIYAESLNPIDFVIYVSDLREKHKDSERYWEIRAKAYCEAVKFAKKRLSRVPTRMEIKKELEKIVTKQPELQRDEKALEEVLDAEKYDEYIDKMNEQELLEGYTDPLKDLESEKLVEQCLYLYNTYNMKADQIGELLGITVYHAKKIINIRHIMY